MSPILLAYKLSQFILKSGSIFVEYFSLIHFQQHRVFHRALPVAAKTQSAMILYETSFETTIFATAQRHKGMICILILVLWSLCGRTNTIKVSILVRPDARGQRLRLHETTVAGITQFLFGFIHEL